MPSPSTSSTYQKLFAYSSIPCIKMSYFSGKKLRTIANNVRQVYICPYPIFNIKRDFSPPHMKVLLQYAHKSTSDIGNSVSRENAVQLLIDNIVRSDINCCRRLYANYNYTVHISIREETGETEDTHREWRVQDFRKYPNNKWREGNR